MLKAGKLVLLIASMLLVAASKIHAQDLPKVNLVTVKDSANICESVLKPYVLTYSKDCPIQEERQIQFIGNIKSNQSEKFSVSHSLASKTYIPPVKSEPTPTPIKIVSEIEIPTPSPTVIVSEQNITHIGNNPDVIFELVNNHRASIGKVPFIKDEALCSLAQTRANEIGSEMSRGVLHSGLYNRDLGYFITENAKTGGDENETVRWWLNSYIHRSQIQSDYTNACVGCVGKNCALLFTSYTPKGNKLALAE